VVASVVSIVFVYGKPAIRVALSLASLAGGAAHALDTAAAESKASAKPVATARRRDKPTMTSFLPHRGERNLLVIATLLSVGDRARGHGPAGRLQPRGNGRAPDAERDEQELRGSCVPLEDEGYGARLRPP